MEPAPAHPKWIGPLMIAAGLLSATFGKPSPGVPHWVAYMACAAFVLAGLVIIAPAFRFSGLSRYLIVMLIACLTAIPTWIALGPGPRHCSGGLSLLGIFFHSSAPGDAECRVAFGISAVMMWGIFIWAIVRLVRGKKGS